MTASVLRFAVPPERLDCDVSRYMDPEIGPTWPQEVHNVVLNDLRPELENPDMVEPVMKQLDVRGFAVLKHRSQSLGSLEAQAEWNAAYLEVSVPALPEINLRGVNADLEYLIAGDYSVCF